MWRESIRLEFLSGSKDGDIPTHVGMYGTMVMMPHIYCC